MLVKLSKWWIVTRIDGWAVQVLINLSKWWVDSLGLGQSLCMVGGQSRG